MCGRARRNPWPSGGGVQAIYGELGLLKGNRSYDACCRARFGLRRDASTTSTIAVPSSLKQLCRMQGREGPWYRRLAMPSTMGLAKADHGCRLAGAPTIASASSQAPPCG